MQRTIFGLSDRQEVVVTPNTGMQAQANAEDIIKNIPQLNEGN